MNADIPDARLPVSLLTGFLGSGKTTLLNAVLRHPDMARTAVVVNEFGEVPLDHHFVQSRSGEVVIMANGCLCCSVQGDLEGVVGSLFARRDALPVFDRMLIETSGLADPAPIMQMLLNQPLVIDNFTLDAVVTTVDAVHAERQIAEHEAAFKQVALADRLVITKADLCPGERTAALEARLRSLNPAASILRAVHGEAGPALLRSAARPDSASGAERWLAGALPGHRHDGEVASFVLEADRPLPWSSLNRWLTSVRIRHGEGLLRVKGIVSLEGRTVPVALHGVHHVFHPPEPLPHLAGVPGMGGARLVFIGRGLPAEEIAQGWRALLEGHGIEAGEKA